MASPPRVPSLLLCLQQQPGTVEECLTDVWRVTRINETSHQCEIFVRCQQITHEIRVIVVREEQEEPSDLFISHPVRDLHERIVVILDAIDLQAHIQTSTEHVPHSRFPENEAMDLPKMRKALHHLIGAEELSKGDRCFLIRSPASVVTFGISRYGYTRMELSSSAPSVIPPSSASVSSTGSSGHKYGNNKYYFSVIKPFIPYTLRGIIYLNVHKRLL